MSLAIPFTTNHVINGTTTLLDKVRNDKSRVDVLKATGRLVVDTVINTLTLPIFLGLSLIQAFAQKSEKDFAKRITTELEWARFSNLPKFIARIFVETIAIPLTPVVGLISPEKASKLHQKFGLVGDGLTPPPSSDPVNPNPNQEGIPAAPPAPSRKPRPNPDLDSSNPDAPIAKSANPASSSDTTPSVEVKIEDEPKVDIVVTPEAASSSTPAPEAATSSEEVQQ